MCLIHMDQFCHLHTAHERHRNIHLLNRYDVNVFKADEFSHVQE